VVVRPIGLALRMDFPSLKAPKLLAILEKEPLAYEVSRQQGSHRRMKSRNGYPSLTFSWHDRATIPPGLVRKTLVKDVGLSEKEALKLI
jgi:predicted RNA binding protein YcfA (HicA-like mRNA interferase family)